MSVEISTIETASKITAVIKTFERPDKLRSLWVSIRNYFPTLPVIIIDDSYSPVVGVRDNFTQYVHTEYDIGLSEGRNRAVALATTPYVLLLDDDFLFTKTTQIQFFLELLENTSFDLVAGDVLDFGRKIRNFRGIMIKENDLLYLSTVDQPHMLEGHPQYDFVINFFLARTSILRKHPWDSELKIREHEDFFWRLKQNGVKITHTPRVTIDHYPDSDIENSTSEFYQKRTLRFPHYHQLACLKIGVKDFKVRGDMYYEPWSLYYFLGRNLKKLEANQDKNRFMKSLYCAYRFIKPVLDAFKRLLIRLGILIRTQ